MGGVGEEDEVEDMGKGKGFGGLEGKAEIAKAERDRKEVVVARGDIDVIAIDQEVARDGGIGPGAGKDTEHVDLVRNGRRGSPEIAVLRGRIGDIEAGVRIEEGAEMSGRSEEGVKGPEGADHQRALGEVDPQILETTEEAGVKTVKDVKGTLSWT